MPTGVQELKLSRGGAALYIYFAWVDGKWIDLAPYGNRIPAN
jgi:hypothetical protein